MSSQADLPPRVAALVEAVGQLPPDEYRRLMTELRKRKWVEGFAVVTAKDWRRFKDRYHDEQFHWLFLHALPATAKAMGAMDAANRKKLARFAKGRGRDTRRAQMFERIEAKLHAGDLADLDHAFKTYRLELGRYRSLRTFSAAYGRWASKRSTTS